MLRNILYSFWNILYSFWNILEHSACILKHSGCILEHSACILQHSGKYCMHSGTFWIFLHAFWNILEGLCDCMQAYVCVFICITFISCLVLSCTVLYCLVLSCTVLYCIVLSVTTCTVLVLVLVWYWFHLCAFLRISPMDSQKRNAHRHRQNSFTLYCIAWLWLTNGHKDLLSCVLQDGCIRLHPFIGGKISAPKGEGKVIWVLSEFSIWMLWAP